MRTVSRANRDGGSANARWWLAALPVCAVFALLSIPAYAQDDDDDEGRFETNEVVVKINPASPNATIQQINARYGTTTKDTFLASSKIYLLDTNGRAADDLADEMESDARLLYAEPNFTTDSPEGNPFRYGGRTDYRPDLDSTEAEYSSTQYAIDALRLPQARQIEDGAGATVAVLDTGIQPNHPELSGRLVAGYDFIDDDPNPDDVGNGVDDDEDNETDEMVGHGTHVAGIVHLTAPGARIMPMRVLDSEGNGNIFLIAEAVQRSVTNGADVINMSLGSSQESELIADITEDLAAVPDDDDDDDDDVTSIRGVPPEGVVVVASAGNENEETENYPAAEEGVISVASVEENERRSEFSSFGQWVDVAAPGEEIHSLYPTSDFASWDGTSMSAPFVAGQAALIRGMRPTLPAASDEDAPARPSVERFIKSSARDIDAKNPNFQGKLGAGHADVAASLRAANAAPTVAAMNPKPGARIKSRNPTIAATVRDLGARLTKSDIRLFVHGKARTGFTYNVNTGRLIFESSRLPVGGTTVRIIVTDAAGKKTDRKWTFRVVR